MHPIISLLDKRFPVVEYLNFEAWGHAARAGDRVSQYRLGRSLLDAGTYTDIQAAKAWLWQSAKQDFAPAKYWLGVLAAEGAIPSAKMGASLLWKVRAAACAWRDRKQADPPLRARLHPLARSARTLNCGERHKLHYAGWWGRPAHCAVEIGHSADGRLAVLLQSLPTNAGTSVTNMIESLAFRALIELMLDGYDPDPNDIAWYELWPAETYRREGKVHQLALQWDAVAERYREPRWNNVDAKSVPFDVSHAVLTEELL